MAATSLAAFLLKLLAVVVPLALLLALVAEAQQVAPDMDMAVVVAGVVEAVLVVEEVVLEV